MRKSSCSISIFYFILFSLFGQIISAQTIQQEKRLALVIGNGNYSLGILANPENDAEAMNDVLQKLGFTVFKYENLSQEKMKRAIDDFGTMLKGNDVGLFFYAGHGIQSKGYNYLVPIDAQLKTEADVEYDCVQADRILAKMESSGSKVNIIILDACRNNPFERSWTRSEAGKGLAFMNAPSGTLIAYSTSPGSTALDGGGKNSPYTTAILDNIVTPSITINQMFQNVGRTLKHNTGDQQTPWIASSLIGDFYFNNTENNNLANEEEVSEKRPSSSKLINPNFPSNGIKITRIVGKPREITKPDNSTIQDTLLYAILDKGKQDNVKHNSYLNVFLPKSSESPISGEVFTTRPQKIGHIKITDSFKNTSEGKVVFKNKYDFKKDFNAEVNYAMFKKLWLTIYANFRDTQNGHPGLMGGIMAQSKWIGGYFEFGMLSMGNPYNSYALIAGLVKNVTPTTGIRIGYGDGPNDFDLFEIGGTSRFNRVSIIYGFDYIIFNGYSDQWYNEFKPKDWTLSFGLGYSF